MMVALDLLVVSTALPSVRRDLGTSAAGLQWAVTAYGLCFAAMLMTGAALGDRFGRRRVFVVGLGVFTVASASCALAPSFAWLVGARAVQGTGAALVMPVAVALLSTAVPADRRARALGSLEGLTGLATIAGPVLGGVVAQVLAWQWIFWINVPVGLVVMVLATRRLDESHGGEGPSAIDVPGVLLVTGAGAGLVAGLVRGEDAGWDSPQVVAPLATGTALAILFVVWQGRARHPMLPLRLFRRPAFSAGAVAGLCLFASLYLAVYFMAQYLQTGLGDSPAEAGLHLAPWTATLVVVAPLAGVLADRIGERPLLVVGLLLQAAGLAWLAATADPDVAYLTVLMPLVVAGVGSSMAIPVVQSAVIGAVAARDVGTASGVNSAVQELGGVVGVAAGVAVFAGAGSYVSAAAFVAGVAPALAVAALVALAGAAAGLAVPRRSAGKPGEQARVGRDTATL